MVILGKLLFGCAYWLLFRQQHNPNTNDDLLYTLTHNELTNPLQSALASLDNLERRNSAIHGTDNSNAFNAQDTASGKNIGAKLNATYQYLLTGLLWQALVYRARVLLVPGSSIELPSGSHHQHGFAAHAHEPHTPQCPYHHQAVDAGTSLVR